MQEEYGGPEVLKVLEVPIPVPGPDQVLVEVRAASINEWDQGLMRGTPLVNRSAGLRRPRRRTLGSDVAGVVHTVGSKVTWFARGDEVFGDLSRSGFGAFAEFALARPQDLIAKPEFLTFEQAAAVPQAGGLAMAALAKGGPLRAGRRVAVNGGGGGAGTFAIQVAKAAGLQVTGIDAPGKLGVMSELGADEVIDYTRADFTRTRLPFDLIIDMVSHRWLTDYRRALRPQGTCAIVGGDTVRLLTSAALGQLLRAWGGRRVALVIYRANQPQAMAGLVGLMREGSVRPVIDRVFGLSDGVDGMHHYLSGSFTGKVVLAM